MVLHTTSKLRRAAFNNAYTLFFMSGLTAVGLVGLFVAGLVSLVG